MVKETNAAQNSYKLAINQFSDMTQEEWARTYLQEAESTDGQVEDAEFAVNEEAFTWTTKGAVGPVKDQGQCKLLFFIFLSIFLFYVIPAMNLIN